MATSPSPNDAVTADDVLTVQFTHIRKGGYDTQEVDSFLDRVAITLDRDAGLLPPGAMSGDDVRMVQFNQVKRGGYDTQEVDNFLDQIVALLGAVGATPMAEAPRAETAVPGTALPEPPIAAGPVGEGVAAATEVAPGVDVPDVPDVSAAPPAPEAEAVSPASAAPAAVADLGFEDVAPQTAPAPPVSATGNPQLHDPGGAAQKLLAAAQQAADILTAEANAYNETTRRSADEYAAATRGEADDHAARVTTAAEAQAASIREVAADEARRVAEEARAALVNEIDVLEARKAGLANATVELESAVAIERATLLAVIDGLRDQVAGELPDAGVHGEPAAGLDTGPLGDETSEVADAGVAPESEAGLADDLGVTQVENEVAAAFAPEPVAPAEAVEVLEDPLATSDPTVAEAEAAVPQPADEEPAQPESTADDAAAAAGRSVFDLVDDAAGDADAGWLDDGLDEPSDATSPSAPSSGLFDIEADPDWNESAGGTRAAAPDAGSGESFFDELRQAEAEAEGLGPLDDDTDAALSAFFEGDEPDSGGSRWRDRFGPGKD